MRDEPNFKPAPIKPLISFADVDRIDIRVGTIVSVDDIAGSDKLLKLTVDFGDHRRSILAGMKQEREDAREIEGQQALFVVNLEPKKMMGEVSEGMLFDLGYADGIVPALARRLTGDAKPGGCCGAVDCGNSFGGSSRAAFCDDFGTFVDGADLPGGVWVGDWVYGLLVHT